MFDWQKVDKKKNTNEKTSILTDTFMNIFQNFIPHKTKKKMTVKIQNKWNYYLFSEKKKGVLLELIWAHQCELIITKKVS